MGMATIMAMRVQFVPTRTPAKLLHDALDASG